MHIDPTRDSLSYWHATAEPMIPADNLPFAAEVVVIGGGMLGVWTTYWLAKSGVDVVLLEKSAIGWGATGRNGGFLIEGAAIGYKRLIDQLGRDAARDFYALTMQGQKLAYETVAEEGIDCQLRRTGTLSLALNQAELDDMIEQQSLMAEDGHDVQIVDREAIGELISTPLAEEIVGGYLAPTGGTLHSSRYIAGLARAAKAAGARIVKAEVESIQPKADGSMLQTSVGSIDAGRVVVALNAWTDRLIPEMRDVIVPTRGQILAYKATAPVFDCAIGAEITPTAEYWQQRPDGSIIIGGCRADAPNGDSGVREMVPTDDVTAQIEKVLPRLFPELNHLEVDRRWAGLMAFTPDGLPVVDRMDGNESVWYGGGFNGHGMPFGPILGKLLAESVTNESPAEMLTILGRSRFSR